MAFGDITPILLIMLAVAVFAVIASHRLRAMKRGPPVPVVPVEVPPESVELEERRVSACMRCGSQEVRPANLSEGGIPGAGAMLHFICARCGHRGPPLEFSDPTAYRAFVRGLHGEEE